MSELSPPVTASGATLRGGLIAAIVIALGFWAYLFASGKVTL